MFQARMCAFLAKRSVPVPDAALLPLMDFNPPKTILFIVVLKAAEASSTDTPNGDCSKSSKVL